MVTKMKHEIMKRRNNSHTYFASEKSQRTFFGNKRVLPNIATYLMLFAMLFAVMVPGVSAEEQAVDLGTAGNFVILAESGISTTGTTSIVGDIGVSPIDSTAITGFGPIVVSPNKYAVSSLVTGKIYAANYASPTPTVMTTAVSDMRTAYTDAAGRTNPTATEIGAGNINGMTLGPGLYKWGTGVEIPNSVTLSGDANDVWIFQIGQDLIVGNGAIVTLSGGAQAKNIFWQVAGQTTLGTTSDFKGIILSKTAIAFNTGAKLNGRALAQTAVTLDANSVIAPSTSSVTLPTVGTTTTSTTTTSTSTTSTSSSGTGSTGDESEGALSDVASANWRCGEWSACSAEGIRTQTCEQIIGGAVSKQKQTCTPTGTSGTGTVVETNTDSSAQNNQNDQEMRQEVNEQIGVRGQEIRSGEYTISLGQSLRVTALENNVKELRTNGVAVTTEMNITAENDSEEMTTFTVRMRNGQEREIKIMPDTASKHALEILGVRVCSEDNNCTIELKDVGNGTEEKIHYEMQLERDSKILGLFQKKMQVSVYVDAQTGETTVHKPWWAFIAMEAEYNNQIV